MKFQVGDIVVGNELASEYYSITKRGVVLEVTEVNERNFRGKLRNPQGRGDYRLDYDAFDLKESMIQENE